MTPDVNVLVAQHLGDYLVTFDTDFRKLLKRSDLTVLTARV